MDEAISRLVSALGHYEDGVHRLGEPASALDADLPPALVARLPPVRRRRPVPRRADALPVGAVDPRARARAGGRDGRRRPLGRARRRRGVADRGGHRRVAPGGHPVRALAVGLDRGRGGPLRARRRVQERGDRPRGRAGQRDGDRARAAPAQARPRGGRAALAAGPRAGQGRQGRRRAPTSSRPWSRRARASPGPGTTWRACPRSSASWPARATRRWPRPRPTSRTSTPASSSAGPLAWPPWPATTSPARPLAARARAADPDLARRQLDGARPSLEAGEFDGARELVELVLAVEPRDLAALDLKRKLKPAE